MSTKLTLRLESGVINKAKKKARNKGVSLSRMVEDYFKSVAEMEQHEVRESPVLYEIAGVLTGKTKADVDRMFARVHDMVTTGQVAGDVGKLAVFAGVHKFPARVKCAILAWHAVIAALKGDQTPVTTESEQN